MKYILATLSAIVLMVNAFGQGKTDTPEHVKLVGHKIDDRSAVQQPTEIVIASFVELGTPNLSFPGKIYFDHVKIKVASAIRGQLPNEANISYILREVPVIDSESEPKINTAYVMFINTQNPKECRIVKILLATEENQASVKSLIATKVAP